ncbi:hypothetical protein HPB47_007375, partial [Ixodes persulcatus]
RVFPSPVFFFWVKTPTEYEAEYNLLRTGEYSRFHGYAYDGIWALALSIHAVIVRLRANDTRISEFDYRRHSWGRLFKEALNDTNFIGVTGPVRFFRNERKGQILLKQFQRGLDPPMDRTLIVIERTRVNLTIYAVLCILCVLGIILASVFLVINVKFRNQRYIKMSSPYLNNLIIVGCILTYTSVILLGMDSGFTSVTNFPYICAARAWVLMSGFTLAFGAMFSKTWRVHAIFTNIKLNKKVIKDYKLFMVVGVFLMLDVIILTTWQIVDPFYREARQGQPVWPNGHRLLLAPMSRRPDVNLLRRNTTDATTTRCSTPARSLAHPGKPTCGERPTDALCASIAGKQTILTADAHTDDLGCVGSTRTTRAPVMVNDLGRSTSTCDDLSPPSLRPAESSGRRRRDVQLRRCTDPD